ncbi:hypothetical protein ACQEU8_13085 [Streptomyces sp. CA-250714]|uniref:hypothetical protein n=1 Tax=Streptomyces sp. CA-250714 TaxID=3240060 RepID=UPI003D93B41D
MTNGAVSESWQRLLDEANGAGVKTNLASANAKAGGGDNGGGEGGGEPDLKNAKNPWTTASGSLESLRNNVSRALGEMRTGQKGAGRFDDGVDGLESAAMQVRVFDSWLARLTLVRDECDEVSGKLEKAGTTLSGKDEEIKDQFGKYEAKPTPPPGGPSGSW